MDSSEDAKRERQADVVMQIAELAAELDWCIALPDRESPVAGLIMGTEDYLKENGTLIYGPAFIIFSQDPMTGTMTETANEDDGSKLH